MRIMLIVVLGICSLLLSPCDALEPVTEYKNFVTLQSDDVLYRWKVLDNIGSIVFLTTKRDYKEERHDGAVPAWTVYLPINNGSDYIKLRGLIEPEGVSDISDVPVDPERMYTGMITQLGKKGIVTAQIDRPRKGPAVAYVYAYTLEGNYMRQTLLAKFDPDKSNAVYDQYLAEDKRTKVQLEEVNP